MRRLCLSSRLSICLLALLTAAACGKGGDNNKGNNANSTANNANNVANANNVNAANANNVNNVNNIVPSGAKFCQRECDVVADCGDPANFECTGGRCRFTGQQSTCSANEDCVPLLSGWITECEDDSGCIGQVCIAVGGSGRCALEAGGAVACDAIMLADFEATKQEDGSAVTVCANMTGECHDDGYCIVPCTGDDTCGGLTCDTDTGRCICESDAQCAGLTGFDRCYDGVCGCADDTSCDVLEATSGSYVCE